MGIKLRTHIFNIIRQIQKSVIFTPAQMRESATVVSYLRTIKEEATADWIEANPIEYLRGLLEGFEVDNRQKSQLKDLHTKPADEMNRLKQVYASKNSEKNL